MGTQILLTLPDDVYSQAKRLAASTKQDVSEILLETITRSLFPFPTNPNRDKMQKEVEAYKALHPELIGKYFGQYVAVYQGKLVDHDTDALALLKRIRETYPNEVVLRRKVTTSPDPEISVRRPRISKES